MIICVLSNIWGEAYIFEHISEIPASYLIYQIFLVFLGIFLVKKAKSIYLAIFIFSLLTLIYIPTLGIYSFKMIYYFFIIQNIKAFILLLTTWLISLFALIGVVIQLVEYKKLKDVVTSSSKHQQ